MAARGKELHSMDALVENVHLQQGAWILEDCVSPPQLGKPQWPSAYVIHSQHSQHHPPVCNPQDAVVCVSDIHGHVDKCRDIWAQLQQRLGVEGLREATVVFLGDYNDRGHATAEVFGARHTATRCFTSFLQGVGLVDRRARLET